MPTNDTVTSDQHSDPELKGNKELKKNKKDEETIVELDMDMGNVDNGGQGKKQKVNFLKDQQDAMIQEVKQYLKETTTYSKFLTPQNQKEACHNIMMKSIKAERLDKLKKLILCNYFFILNVDTSKYKKLELDTYELPQIYFRILSFKQSRKQNSHNQKQVQEEVNNPPRKLRKSKHDDKPEQIEKGEEKKLKSNLRQSKPADRPKLNEIEENVNDRNIKADKERLYREMSLYDQKQKGLIAPTVISLAELIHLKQIKNQKEFFSTFMSDIMAASAAAYYYHKGEQMTTIRKIFKALQGLKEDQSRDSNAEAAKKFFSKDNLYQALLHAKKILEPVENFKMFLQVKSLFGPLKKDVESTKDNAVTYVGQPITPENTDSLDKLTMPLYRIEYRDWKQFYGGYDVYDKLSAEIRERRKCYKRYERLGYQGKQLPVKQQQYQDDSEGLLQYDNLKRSN